MNRRDFVRSIVVGAFGLGAAWIYRDRFNSKKIPGEILGASAKDGHRIRQAGFPAPQKTIHTNVAIIGAGIAGLASGRELFRSGEKDFLIFDLEKNIGGNSQFGENATSKYPWGAHYVTLPPSEAVEVAELYSQIGLIRGRDEKARAYYDEYSICAEPNERLFRFGRWQEGLIPKYGLNAKEEAEVLSFLEIIERYKQERGSDNKRAFAIPIDRSSQDPNFLALDAISMSDWLGAQGFETEPLRWYVNYCMRDDYGMEIEEVSAWAGLHYFAARNGVAANMASDGVLTWPEGNGHLVSKITEDFREKIQTQCLVYEVREKESGVEVLYFDLQTQMSVRVEAQAAVLAIPRFVARRLLKSPRVQVSDSGFSYSPWMVANVSLSALPLGKGAPLSWDNVVYGSELIGYVVATHQGLRSRSEQTVLTYYYPLSKQSPNDARQKALYTSYERWQEIVLDELYAVHPELRGFVERVDVWLWGHAMIRPTVGFIWGAARNQALQQQAPIFFAHSDMAGISIFEEAYTYGVHVARDVLNYVRAA